MDEPPTRPACVAGARNDHERRMLQSRLSLDLEFMGRSTSQVRNLSSPAVDMLSAVYCFYLTIKIGSWLVGDGWKKARMGDVPIILMFPAVLTCMLLAVSGLFLCRRRAKSSWFLLGSLLFGLALIPLMLPEIFLISSSLYIKVPGSCCPQTYKQSFRLPFESTACRCADPATSSNPHPLRAYPR